MHEYSARFGVLILTGSSRLPRSYILYRYTEPRWICYPNHSIPPNNLSSMLFFKDIAVELASRDDCFLTDIPHPVLELNQDGRAVDKANLLSRELSRGIWDADEPLILREVTGELILLVSIQLDEHDRQVIGSIELSETELYEIVGMEFEIPLVSHENYPGLILRTRIWTIENIRENMGALISGMIQQTSDSSEDGTVENVFSGVTAYKEFKRYRKLEHLEQAISKFEAAANVTLEDNPTLPRILNNLGSCLGIRFEHLGQIADIDKSIERLESAAALTGDNDPDKPRHLGNLWVSLMRRFERSGAICDIDSAIIHLQMAVSLTLDEHPHKPMYLNNLGTSLQTRFKRFGKVDDIDSSIVYQEMAVSLTPDEHLDKPMYLSNLGTSLLRRFERFGKAGDI
ncbi:hypothetical protein CPB86DRAFT_744776, partial [Serendipita vermifera]